MQRDFRDLADAEIYALTDSDDRVLAHAAEREAHRRAEAYALTH